VGTLYNDEHWERDGEKKIREVCLQLQVYFNIAKPVRAVLPADKFHS